MGASYSATKLKVQLKSATSRMVMSTNKRNNAIRIDSRLIGSLLQQRKDESARIKVEGLLHQRNLVSVMETLQLMCDLLATRIQIITHSTEVPSDLEESIATLIYASQRVEIPELELIAHQFVAKYGEKAMRLHLNNDLGRVNPRVVEKLQINPPDFALVISTMQDIAAQWEVDWKPDLSVLDSGVKGQDPERLGSIAGGPKPAEGEYKEADLHALPVAARGPAPPGGGPAGAVGGASGGAGEGGGGGVGAGLPRAAERKEEERRTELAPASRPAKSVNLPDPSPSFVPAPRSMPLPVPAFQPSPYTPSDESSYPGTLNIILLQARDLPQSTSSASTIVTISEPSTSLRWSSLPALPSASLTLTPFPPNQHCPLSVTSPTTLIIVEVSYHPTRPSSSSPSSPSHNAPPPDIIGGLSIEAEQLRRSGVEGTWYTIFTSHSHAPRGQVLLASQYMPMVRGSGVGSAGGGGGGEEPVYHVHVVGSGGPPGGVVGEEPPAYEGGDGDGEREGEPSVPLLREEAYARGSGVAGPRRRDDADAHMNARFKQLG